MCLFQRVAECCSAFQCVTHCTVLQYAAVCCAFNVLQCVAVCCSVLQCVAVCCSTWQCVAHSMCCRMLRCVKRVLHSLILSCILICIQCVAVSYSVCVVFSHSQIVLEHQNLDDVAKIFAFGFFATRKRKQKPGNLTFGWFHTKISECLR